MLLKAFVEELHKMQIKWKRVFFNVFTNKKLQMKTKIYELSKNGKKSLQVCHGVVVTLVHLF